MTRTQVAALQAAGAGFLLVAGTGAVAGFGLVPSAISGLVAAALAGALLLGASRRAGTAGADAPDAAAGTDDPLGPARPAPGTTSDDDHLPPDPAPAQEHDRG